MPYKNKEDSQAHNKLYNQLNKVSIAAKNKEYRKRNKEQLQQKRSALWKDKDYCKFENKKKAIRKKMAFLEIYGKECANPYCRDNDFATLSADHINNDGNNDRKRDHPRNFYKALIKQTRRADIQVLCMNCQFRKRFYGNNDFSYWHDNKIEMANPSTVSTYIDTLKASKEKND